MGKKLEGEIFLKKWTKGAVVALLAGSLFCTSSAWAEEQSSLSFDLDQIVVTATKTEKKIKDVPASVSVITAKELEQANVKTLDDALQYVPGVYINNQTGMKANKISIRGLAQNRVLVLVDGIPMNQGYTGSPLRDVPISNIERVEIIKGPFSALYGSSAMGGVINVITKEATKPQTIFKVATGEENTHRYSISHNNSLGKMQYYLDYYKMDTDGYITDPKKPQDGNFGKDNEKYNAKVIYRFNDKDKVTVISGKTENEYGYEYRVGKGARTAKENNLQYVHKFDEDREVKVQIGEFTVDPYWTLQGANYSSNPTKTKTGEVNYNWKTNEKNLLTIGLSTKLDSYDGYTLSNSKIYKDISGAKAKTNSIYLQDELKLNEKTTAYLGGRYDKWKFYDGYNLKGKTKERDEENFSPKLAFVYKQDEKTTWHFSTGKSFAAPNFINTIRLWPMGSGTGYLTPSEKIVPEKATSYEIGLEKSISNNTLFSANIFQNDVKDMIVQSSYKDDGSIDINNLYWRNVSEASIKGLELELKHKLSPSFVSFINYTYNDSEIKKHENKKCEGNQVPTVPREVLNLGLTYEKGKTTANVRGRYISKVYDNEENTTLYQPHFVVDSKLSYNMNNNTSISLSVDNLFDKKYYEDSLAPGRTVTVELTQKF